MKTNSETSCSWGLLHGEEHKVSPCAPTVAAWCATRTQHKQARGTTGNEVTTTGVTTNVTTNDRASRMSVTTTVAVTVAAHQRWRVGGGG